MSKWDIAFSLLLGIVFAVFGFFKIDFAQDNWPRSLIALFLIGAYLGLVATGTSGKKRSLSYFSQTIIGVLLALALTALFSGGPAAYLIAAFIGFIVGATIDKWAQYVTLP